MRCPKTGCGGEVIDGVCSSCSAPQSSRSLVASSSAEKMADDAPSAALRPNSGLGAAQALTDASAVQPANSDNNVLNPSSPAASSATSPGTSPSTSPAISSVTSPLSSPVASLGAQRPSADERSAELKLQKVSARLKKIDGKEALLQASEALKTVVPDKFESWRAQADLWLAAIRQLQTRELNPDDTLLLMGIPLIERNLRDAAEEALRQCAHFAPTFEQRVALIDEANNIRNMSWF